MKVRVLGAIAAAFAGFLLAGQPAAGREPIPSTAAPPTIDEFLAEPELASPVLSPSGRYLAFVRNQNGYRMVAVLDLRTNAAKSLVTATLADGATYSWLRWKGDDRLLVGWRVYREKRRGDTDTGDLKTFEYGAGVMSVERETGKLTQLLQDDRLVHRRLADRDMVIDFLDQDPGRILMMGVTRGGKPAVWRVDLAGGSGEVIEEGNGRTVLWSTDRDGALVARWDLNYGGLVLYTRGPAGGDYVEAARMHPRDLRALPDFEFLGNTDKPGQVFVRMDPTTPADGDTASVRVFDFVTRKVGPAVWQHPRYDVESIVRDRRTGALLAGCYTAEVFRCDFTDPAEGAAFDMLLRHFKGQRNVVEVSRSADGGFSVLRVSGPDHAGAFFLFERAAKALTPLGDAWPALTGRLAVMERVSWTAQDGTRLEGYLTLPRTTSAGSKPPLVVMPHGGPESRDRYDYNLWVQFLATRGYAVFQPNFRGSSGFGRAFARAGYGQWGRLMQADVEDGVQHLIDAGRVDGSRMCIFGASYGGYVALQAGASRPDRYRCIVSFSGVSDLPGIMAWEAETFGRDSERFKYWAASIGDPRSDRERLDAVSPIRRAADFRAPVLLVHGEEDDVSPISQSRNMARKLQIAGRPYVFIELNEEGHDGWRKGSHRRALEALEAFLAQHLAPAR